MFAVGVLGLAAFLGSGAPSVGAAESFPGQGFLPDNRAWEMVSPPDKNGGDVFADTGRTRAAADGNAIQFSSLAPFGDVEGTGTGIDYMARRDAAPGTHGWATHALTPAQPAPSLTEIGAFQSEPYYVSNFSHDLSRGVYQAFKPLAGAQGSADNVSERMNLYLRTDLGSPGPGEYHLLTGCPACSTPLTFNIDQPRVMGANEGDSGHEPFSHIIFEAKRKLTEDAPGGSSTKLYEALLHGSDELQALSVDATAGQYRLSFAGQSTADVPFDAPASSVESALDALPTIAPGSVTVDGGPGDAGATSPYAIAFSAGPGIAGTDVPEIEVQPGTTPLSGGAAAATVETRLPGGQDVRLAGRVPPGSATECDDGGAVQCIGSNSTTGPESRGLGGLAYPLHTVSADGSRIVFRSSTNGNVYLREGGRRTVQLNVAETSAPTAHQSAEYWTASADDSRVLFSTEQQLLDEDTNGRSDLYMYDVNEPHHLTMLSQGDGDSGGFNTVAGAGASADYVYFTTGRQLLAGEPVISEVGGVAPKYMYVWHTGNLSYIGALYRGDADANTPAAASANNVSRDTARVSEDGRHFLFTARYGEGLVGRGGLTTFDPGDKCIYNNGPCHELLLYSADTSRLVCASCPEGAATSPISDVQIGERENSGGSKTTDHLTHALSEDGRYVFFQTGERLVPEDSNGQTDVYEYDALSGEQHLISSGESAYPSYFLDASDDGRDVFIDTREQLSGWDVDGAFDVYDARAGGGLPEPAPAPASCQGDACQPAPRELNDPTPASSSYSGPADASPSQSCAGPARRAHRLARRARALQRRAHRAHSAANAKRIRHRSRRLAQHAHRLSTHAKRCKRAERRTGK